MTTAETLTTSQPGTTSFWLLMPKWLRRLNRHCEDCGGTTFERETMPAAPPVTSADRARQIDLLQAHAVLYGFRNGAVRR